MDESVRLLVERIRTQLGSVLNEAGREFAPNPENWIQSTRSPDINKLDESGISSEEGCLPQPVYSQLATIASLVGELKTKLDSNTMATCDQMLVGVGGNSGRKRGGEREGGFTVVEGYVPELMVLGRHGVGSRERVGVCDNAAPVVYSRSSAQLLTNGEAPNPDTVVQKDLFWSRCAEVLVKPPSEAPTERMWTRSGTRAAHLGVNYMESFSSSSDFSSSDRDSEESRVGERRKKRIRRKKTQKTRKDPKVGRADVTKPASVTELVSSTEDEQRGVVEEWESGGVQMECEIGGDDTESPTTVPFLLQSSTLQANTRPARSTTVHKVYQVDFDRIRSPERRDRLTDLSRGSQNKVAVGGDVDVDVDVEKVVKPCSVEITKLPRQALDHYLSKSVKKESSTNRTVSPRQEEDTSSSDSSSSDAESVSMLAAPPTPRRMPLSSESLTSGSSKLARLTPRKLGSRGRSPVAKRTLPFSKSPKNIGSCSRTPTVGIVHSTTPSLSPTPSKSPSPTPTLPSTPGTRLTPSHSPPTKPSTSSASTGNSYLSVNRTPSRMSRVVTRLTKSLTHRSPAPVGVRSSASPAARKTKSLSPSSSVRRESGRVAPPAETVAIGWDSDDDDFKGAPAASLVMSPSVSVKKRSPRTPSVKTETNSDAVSSVKLKPSTLQSTTGGMSGSNVGPAAGDGVDEVVMTGAREERGSGLKKRSPVKAAAHSVSGDSAEPEGLPGEISCAGCGKSIHWKNEHVHQHKRLNVLICQACWKVYHTGLFEIAEGKEIYCTLCGDGGSMISCDNSSCTSSFCHSCIRRISGEHALRQLIEEEELLWECFCCDSAPLAVYKSVCRRVCEYYSRDGKERGKLGGVGGECGVGGVCVGDSVRVEELKGEGVRGGGGVNSEGGEGGRGTQRGRGEKPTRDGSRRRQNKTQGEGEGEGGGDKKRPNRRRKVDNTSNSEVESSSGDEEEDSPQVDTDDVSLSDSSIFGARKTTNSGANNTTKPDNTEMEGDAAKDSKGDSKKRSVSSSSSLAGGDSQKLARKKGKKGDYLSALRARLGSDSDSDFEGAPKKTSPNRRLTSSSSSNSDSKGKKEKREKEGGGKRSNLLNILSSGSEDEGTLQRKTEREKSRKSDDDGSSSDAHSAVDLSSPNLESGAVVYATQRELSASSDSDDDMGVLERKQKHARALGSDSSGEGKATKSGEGGGDVGNKKGKQKKRRKRVASSSDDFESRELQMRGPQLKRRRVARVIVSDSDSEDSVQEEGGGSEGEKEGNTPDTPGKKRKKIRKVMTDAKLQTSTREALRMERERIERLKKRQSLAKEKEDELVLEEDPKTKKPLIKVRQSLVKSVKPHQWDGIRFLYDACVEKLEMFREGRTQAGAILAHCMGLGKTLQVIALVDALLMHADSGVNRVLVLSPVNTIYNWRNEFERWIPTYDCEYHIYMLVDPSVDARVRKLERWFSGGGVLFVGYELFRNLVMGKRLRKKKKEAFEKYLLDPGPDIIVCDEGHVMRNAASNLTNVLQRVRTRARIVLTGTPLQNNLVEYHTMVSFVKPNLLGTVKEFKNRFANPITQGRCRDSTPNEIRVMKNRAHVLHDMLSGTIQRRDYRVLARFLPPKQEFVLFIRLSPVQEGLYTRYLGRSSGTHSAADLFSTFSNLQKVWNHPWVLRLDEDRKFEREERKRMFEDSDGGSLDGFIVYSTEEEEEEEEEIKKKKKKKVGSVCRASSSSGPSRSATPAPSRSTGTPDTNPNQPTSTISLCSSDEDELTFPEVSLKPDPDAPPPTKPITRSSKPAPDGPSLSLPVGGVDHASRPTSPPEWYDDLLTPECEGSAAVSGKIRFLLELLQEAAKLKEKVLVFTQSLLTLDLIEEVLGRAENGEWTPGLDYYRLDGSTRSEMRTHQMSDFNEVDNEQLRLYLISTRAGSLGVNLVGANRVVIFDACWNPSHDLQAVFRSYRFGQTKPIFVYRLLAKGTMEEKIYDRQVTKESIALRVVDEKQVGRHYNASDLAELFTYSPAPPVPPEDQMPVYERPQADKVLNQILDRLQPQWIVNYHEHDSLLKHVFSEELSEEERKAAWDDYRTQITQYDNAAYYTALQSQLDLAAGTAIAAAAQPSVGVPSNGLPGASGLKTDGVKSILLQHQHQQQQEQRRQEAGQLLTVLSDTNRHVRSLIGLLQEKTSLGNQQNEFRRQGLPIPPNLAAKLALNEKHITVHYALVEEGVRRVNSTLQLCHTGQVYLGPTANKMVNALRSQLIANLDVLKSGSRHSPHGLPPQSVAGGSGVGVVSSSGAQMTQQQRVLQQVRDAQIKSSTGQPTTSTK